MAFGKHFLAKKRNQKIKPNTLLVLIIKRERKKEKDLITTPIVGDISLQYTEKHIKEGI